MISNQMHGILVVFHNSKLVTLGHVLAFKLILRFFLKSKK